MLMRIGKIAVTLLAASWLASCAVQGGVTSSYNLTAVPPVAHARHQAKTSLYVGLPDTSDIYNTTDMIYSTYAYQVNSFVKSNWAATPPQMLQPLMVETLQNTHHFYTVTTSTGAGQFNYMLVTQLLKFQQDFNAGHSQFCLTLRAEIVDATTNKVIASRKFTIVEPAPQNSPYGGVIAANNATARMLAQLARFCLHKI